MISNSSNPSVVKISVKKVPSFVHFLLCPASRSFWEQRISALGFPFRKPLKYEGHVRKPSFGAAHRMSQFLNTETERSLKHEYDLNGGPLGPCYSLELIWNPRTGQSPRCWGRFRNSQAKSEPSPSKTRAESRELWSSELLGPPRVACESPRKQPRRRVSRGGDAQAAVGLLEAAPQASAGLPPC